MISLIKKTLTVSTTTPTTAGASKGEELKDQIEEAVEATERLHLAKQPSADIKEWQETVYDLIRDIRDPEKPETLEELDVVREDLVWVDILRGNSRSYLVRVEFVPTVPHCSLATLIGLCLRTKLDRELPPGQFKIELGVKEGTHSTASEVTKQINDKERVAAALENPNLLETVERCIKDDE